MYEDDTALFYASSSIRDVNRALNADLRSIEIWLESNKLTLNVNKCKAMLFGTRNKLRLGKDQLIATLCGKCLEVVSTFKYLGVWLDPYLTWQDHIDKLCNAVSSRLGVLRRLTPVLPQRTLEMLLSCMILPKLDYCDVVWGNCGKCLSDKLQKLHNRAARIILGLSYSSHVGNNELSSLHWKTLATRRNDHLLQTVYKSVNHQLPEYLHVFHRVSETHNYPTRHSLSQSIQLPLVQLECGRRKFRHRGACSWNELQQSVKTAPNIEAFKYLLKSRADL